jgi:hypothetical protein
MSEKIDSTLEDIKPVVENTNAVRSDDDVENIVANANVEPVVVPIVETVVETVVKTIAENESKSESSLPSFTEPLAMEEKEEILATTTSFVENNESIKSATITEGIIVKNSICEETTKTIENEKIKHRNQRRNGIKT